MNALFGQLKTEGLEEVEDRLGGFRAFESDAYVGTIKQMYAGESAGGARNVTVIIDIDGTEHRETVYVTNKKGENFFLNKNDQTKKVPLPGFTTIDDICLVATGTPLSEQNFEEKMVKMWDKDAGKEIPKAAMVAVDCLGKKVGVALLKVLSNKTQKDSQGNYVAIPDERTTNEIDKVFDPETRLTVVEARNEATEATFMDAWVEKNQGETRDKREIKDGQGGNAGRPNAPTGGSNAGSGAQRKTLFGNKQAA